MELVHSAHWVKKLRYRPEITDDLIEYAIHHSNELRDTHLPDASNSTAVFLP